MTKKVKRFEQIMWGVAFLSMVLISPSIVIFGYGEFVLAPLAFTLFIPFILLLENKRARVMKGISLIMFGVFWSLIYLEVIKSLFPDGELPLALTDHFDLLSNLAIFACAGAGGSIIGSYGEEKSEDRPERIVKEVHYEKTQHIEALLSEFKKQHRNFKILYWLISGVLFLQLVQFIS